MPAKDPAEKDHKGDGIARLYVIVRDRQVVRMLRLGFTPKQIRLSLGVGLSTVYKAIERSAADRRRAKRSTGDRRKSDMELRKLLVAEGVKNVYT